MGFPKQLNDVAGHFIGGAICEFGQDEATRLAAVQDVLDAAGFDATATCWPIFGAIWPKPCTGPDSEAASAWLWELTKTMKRGKFERERDHVLAMIERRRSTKGA